MPPSDPRPPVTGVLDESERLAVQESFGVARDQVVRDHVISHTLAAIATLGTRDVLFFGGTALARTHLPALRLSEDIDLIAIGHRGDVAGRIESALQRALGRTLGVVELIPRLRDVRDPDPSVMYVGDVRIQIQLLSAGGYPAWPTEVVDIEQRYSDAPSARLRVPTAPAFVASKLSAWSDRRAPRDLYDLWALGEKGLIGADAVRLFGQLGSFTSAAQVTFDRLPLEAEWAAALGHQGRLRIGPADAAVSVQRAIAATLGD